MLFAPAFIVLLALTSKGVTGQSVTQTPNHLTIKEGTATFINCTYQYSGVVYVFWYIQRSHSEAPQLLLTEFTGKEKKDGFFAEHLKPARSFHLEKEASVLNDSATYFCAEVPSETPSSKQKLPWPSKRDNLFFLPCTYEASGSTYLFWYEQCPNEGLQLLVSSYSMEARGFVAHQDKQETSFNLTKDSGELRDSAVYFCALIDTVRRVTGREGGKPTQWQSIETLLYKASFDGKHQFS